MDTPTSKSIPYITAITLPCMVGCEFGGGHFAGVVMVDAKPYGLIVSPKTEGHFPEISWNERSSARVAGAESFSDGLANTRAMAEAGSEIAKKVLDLKIGGFGDWYIPSRDELELCYRAFKPTKETNWVHRNGDNPSSLPPGYPYTETSPGLTELPLFQERGGEAFPDGWHWSSTQPAGYESYAWVQGFGDGDQSNAHKDGEYSVRAVRRAAL